MATATVIVESRHLDTDARVREEHEVAAPADLHQERSRLIALVRDLHPQATHRSYADGAATFLERDHLIVAFYESRDLLGQVGRSGLVGAAPPAQGSLFES